MPLVKLIVNQPVPESKQPGLLSALSKITAITIGKPEQYVMVTLQQGAVLMSGHEGPGCFVEVRSIGGLGPEVNHRLSAEICGVLKRQIGLDPTRIYLNFMDIEAAHWGWNNETFG